MPAAFTTFITLVEPHLPIIVGLAAGTCFTICVQLFASEVRRLRRRQERTLDRKHGKSRAHDFVRGPWLARSDLAGQPDAVDQLPIVMGADFFVQALLNKSEARVFRELDGIVVDRNPGWQVMAQVSLGEILRCRDDKAYRCINSKRVDLLLVDENCRPRHAVEYQGGAHHQGTAAARDAVKKEALRRAGIGYHEVVAGLTTPSDLRRLVERFVDQPAPGSGSPGHLSVTPAERPAVPRGR